ncbi:MAG: hypothetical protein JNN04_09110 [Cyclobacteriaceae bacterium]|nr:hypothetical protein [Cyclobacteriaceae bacterium]
MARTLLIPTDFSIESLWLLKEALRPVQIGKVSIILLHCVYTSDSIVELLFFSRKELVDKLINEDFRDACKILRRKYTHHIESLRIEIFSGNTQRAFKDFLLANHIDEILLPHPFGLKNVHRDSFSPEPFIRNCHAVVTEVAWQPSEDIPEKNKLAAIFLL